MPKKEIKKGEIIIFETSGKEIELKVRLEKESVWLSLNQIAELFGTDKSGVSRHIKNIFKSGEVKQTSVVAKIATTASDGKTYNVDYYNLDVILSVGYRVNSKKATQFRIWATDVLKRYILDGYTVNEKRLLETQENFKKLQLTIEFLKRKSRAKMLKGQEKEILDLLADYSKTLTILEEYDKDNLKKLGAGKAIFRLEYEKLRNVIFDLKKELIKKKEAGDIFGMERGDAFRGIIGNIYQTFAQKELYKTTSEKAAHLLYFIIKDHPFSDGNKRIGSFVFVYFLDKNNYLHRETGEKKINDNALAALALLVAESDPKEKEQMIALITQLLK